MDIVHGSEREFVPTSLTHRASGLAFKILFEGSDEDPANNYQLALVSQKDFSSPVHKHNFDQLRYAWQGDFSIGPHSTIHEGELCYHPEGVSYGPQSDDSTPRVLYILQFGGASGQGYIAKNILRASNIELEKLGTFKDGRFHPHDGGQSIDGFQALWEHATKGKKLVYPAPRYSSTIMVKPQNFEWKQLVTKDNESLKVWRKLLGVFSERGTLAQEIKLDPLAHWAIEKQDGVQFLIVKRGLAQVGTHVVQRESTIRLQPGQDAQVYSERGAEFLHYIIPTYK